MKTANPSAVTASVPKTLNAVKTLPKNVPNAVLIAALPAKPVYEVVSLALHPPALPDAFAVAVPALTGVTAFSVIPLRSVSAAEYRSSYVIEPNVDVTPHLQDLKML